LSQFHGKAGSVGRRLNWGSKACWDPLNTLLPGDHNAALDDVLKGLSIYDENYNENFDEDAHEDLDKDLDEDMDGDTDG
jgi:hypothetical protein